VGHGRCHRHALHEPERSQQNDGIYPISQTAIFFKTEFIFYNYIIARCHRMDSRSATPIRPPTMPANVLNAPARKRKREDVPEGANNLVRPALTEPAFAGLVKFPGNNGNRSKY
jgi:hypothetical protein